MAGDNESMVIASKWASMAAWFTPTVLFCILNLIIAIIFIAANSKTTKHNDHVPGGPFSRIPRVSSFLDRARSINLSSYITTVESPHQSPSRSKTAKYSSLSRLAQSIYVSCSYDTQPESKRYPSNKPNPSPSLLGRLKCIQLSSIYGDPTVSAESDQISNSPSQLVRVPSFLDRVKSFRSGAPPALTHKEKSHSEVRIVSGHEEDVELRRPETARARRNADDDAKAENFISRFREQLKLQRLESLVRYNEMLRSPN